jgi:hypothetical protein
VIRSGEAAELQQLFAEHPGLAHARIGDPESTQCRSLLHVVTDWPGNVPEAAAKIRALVAAGANVDARFTGPHTETPLHWAASSNDIEALDAAGRRRRHRGRRRRHRRRHTDRRRGRLRPMESRAAATGTQRAHEPVASRGARPGVRDELNHTPAPAQEEELDNALWCAAHGGHRDTANLLIRRGADPAWVGHDRLDAAAAAERSGARKLAEWLRERPAGPVTRSTLREARARPRFSAHADGLGAGDVDVELLLHARVLGGRDLHERLSPFREGRVARQGPGGGGRKIVFRGADGL